jgi:deazaflavin-dependent oxidoreductase (nitroreductase family)
VAARQVQASWWERSPARLAALCLGSWLFVRVLSRIDRFLLRLSGGRLSVAARHPILLLTTKGAKTGHQRSTPLLYVVDGADIILIASNGGSPRHPAWYYNLRAHPEATLLLQGRGGRYRAREAHREERERLWRKAVEAYAGYEAYSRWTGGRKIPVMILSPQADSPTNPQPARCC